jgi:phospholipid/cholesterol/gamma-HCH transport system ATP-binding protein
MCTHRFEPAEDRMVPLPKGQYDANTTFLMLSEARLIFDGSLHELVTSENPLVREFIE